MTEAEEIAEAKRMPKGSRRALLAMTGEYQLPGKSTFNANAAFNLTWRLRSYGGLAEYRIEKGRAAYRITALGQRIQARLL